MTTDQTNKPQNITFYLNWIEGGRVGTFFEYRTAVLTDYYKTMMEEFELHNNDQERLREDCLRSVGRPQEQDQDQEQEKKARKQERKKIWCKHNGINYERLTGLPS